MRETIATLTREIFTPNSTIGILRIPDFECYTLEDVTRGEKIDGETAIPCGMYEVIISWSSRYQRPMPRLLNVPFFKGILIHPGNVAAHTDGCILVGNKKGPDMIYESVAAFNEIFPRLKDLSEKGKIFLKIEGGFPATAWV